MEVLVALLILSTCALPLLIALGDAQSQIARSKHRRTMKQLLEYKLSHILLDRPAEGEDPIYVEAAEGNFGEDFSNDPDKAYWFDESLYFYNYRIDSEEIDLGSAGGLTGDEEEEAQKQRDRERDDAGGNPFGGAEAEEQEEDLSQLRYRVTLTIEYLPGNANFAQHMSIVTYVRHPHQSEAMSGPDARGGGPGGPGGLGGADGDPSGQDGAQPGAGSNLTGGGGSTSTVTGTSPVRERR